MLELGCSLCSSLDLYQLDHLDHLDLPSDKLYFMDQLALEDQLILDQLDQLDQLYQLDQLDQLDQPKQFDQLNELDQLHQPDQLNHLHQLAQLHQPDQLNQLHQPDQLNHLHQLDQLHQPDQLNQLHQPDQLDQLHQQDQLDKPDRLTYPDQLYQLDQPDQLDKIKELGQLLNQVDEQCQLDHIEQLNHKYLEDRTSQLGQVILLDQLDQVIQIDPLVQPDDKDQQIELDRMDRQDEFVQVDQQHMVDQQVDQLGHQETLDQFHLPDQVDQLNSPDQQDQLYKPDLLDQRDGVNLLKKRRRDSVGVTARSQHLSRKYNACKCVRILKYRTRLTNFCSRTVLGIMLILLMRISVGQATDGAAGKCLSNRPDVSPRRHFYYQGSSLPLVIEVSCRSSHQLVSRVLRILLSEVLGYDSVELKFKNSSRDISSVLDHMASSVRKSSSRTSSSSYSRQAGAPETMIHTEVWVPAGYNLEAALNRKGGRAMNAGPLGPLSRFGWFMPTEMVERTWNTSQLTVDHWRMLTMEEVTRQFSIDTDTKQLLRNFLTRPDPAHNASYCSYMYGEAACVGGVYIPQQCQHSQSCAMLFSSFPDLDEDIIRQQIEGLGLHVSVAWIGYHLESFVRDRVDKQKATLLFNWVSSDMTAGSTFTRVLFPSCQSPVGSFFSDRSSRTGSKSMKTSDRWRGSGKRDANPSSTKIQEDLRWDKIGWNPDDSGIRVNISWDDIHPHSPGGYRPTWLDGIVPRTVASRIKTWGEILPTGIRDNIAAHHFRKSNPWRNDDVGRNCDFVVNQLTKIMWSVMKTHTPEAHYLVTALTISQAELDSLLVKYSEVELLKQQTQSSEVQIPAAPSWSGDESLLEEIACGWVRENGRLWMRWIPETISSKTVIYLGGLFPLTGPHWRQASIVPGAQMAAEFVNSDPDILGDYDLFLHLKDTQCTVDVAMTQYLQYAINTSHPVAGIVGPGCSETAEPIAGLAKHFNTIVVSYGAEALQLTDRTLFPLFLRTIPHILQNGAVYVAMFKNWGWERVALLAEDGKNFPEYNAFLKERFLSNSIQVIYDRKMPRMLNMSAASKFVEELKTRDVKIIVLTSFEQAARSVVCEAYHQGITTANGYVWLMPAWFTRQWYHTDLFSRHNGEHLSCTPDEMERTVEGYFTLTTASLAHEETRVAGNVTVGEWKSLYTERVKELNLGDPSPYASYAYDAVMVFALGLDKLLKDDPSSLESLHTDATTFKLMRILDGLEFSGVSGSIKFDGAERTGIVNINQHISSQTVPFRNSSPSDALVRLVGEYMADGSNSSDKLQLNDSLIVWFTPDGSIPSDGRPVPKVCSIERFRALLGVDCDSAVVVANIIGVSLFIVIMILGLIAVKKRYDRKVKKIKDILGLRDTDIMKLDRWQIPREHVVINRKVGEGAFGTVYGGEALIDNAWVAVAVKALKIGATNDIKLDFLSEAEMMKEFEHSNIVKLLGVCTRIEPVYAVMEFMLHGNLKHFLLARRSMVGQTTKEAEDVCAERLTQMALDVASGLEYLTNSKYLHRDLACRNCLVHADKTVKIGDFGLARHIYDSDYYQYNKRGLFPVRWMAPESLLNGVFTAATDVWSYGIVLYEIITFGSLPYPSLSNKCAVDYVKLGNRMSLPLSCPAELAEMISSCWRYDCNDRPGISSLREQLASSCSSSSPIIVPCLESPQNSSQMNNTSNEVLEINLHQNTSTISSSSTGGHHATTRSRTRTRQFSTTSSCETSNLHPHAAFTRALSMTSQDGPRELATGLVAEDLDESSPGAEFATVDPFLGPLSQHSPVSTVVSLDRKQQNPVVSVSRPSLGTIAWQRTKNIAKSGFPLLENFFRGGSTSGGSVSAGLQTVSPSDVKVSPGQSSSESCPANAFIARTSVSSAEDYSTGLAVAGAGATRCYEMTTRKSTSSLGRDVEDCSMGMERLLASPVEEVDEDDVDDIGEEKLDSEICMRKLLPVDTTTSTTDGCQSPNDDAVMDFTRNNSASLLVAAAGRSAKSPAKPSLQLHPRPKHLNGSIPHSFESKADSDYSSQNSKDN